MLNWLWAGMIVLGILWAGIHGNLSAVTNGALSAAKEAVDLCIVMAGVMGMWTGLMEIAAKSGLLGQLNRLLQPVLQYLFPDIPREHPSREHIGTNIVANVLGLGWAATPAGLKAMESLRQLEEERQRKTKETASNEMCTFLVLNISSLQLIPVNIIAYRTQYGSSNPTAVVGPAIVATLVSTAVAVVFCKLMCRNPRNSHR